MKALAFLLSIVVVFSETRAAAAEAGRVSFRSGALLAHLFWLQGPASQGESVLRVEWTDAHQHPVEPGRPFDVSIWMPEMGHGSSPTQLRRVLDPHGDVLVGSYDVAAMYFVMTGTWEVRFSLADGTTETQSWRVEITDPSSSGEMF